MLPEAYEQLFGVRLLASRSEGNRHSKFEKPVSLLHTREAG